MAEDFWQDFNTATATKQVNDPYERQYSFKCDECGFAVYADGNLVWKCEVSEAIIPNGCSFKIEDYKMTVTLQKQKPGVWSEFRAFKNAGSTVGQGNIEGMNRASPWGRSQGQGNTSSNTWKGEGTPGSQGSSKVGELVGLFSQDDNTDSRQRVAQHQRSSASASHSRGPGSGKAGSYQTTQHQESSTSAPRSTNNLSHLESGKTIAYRDVQKSPFNPREPSSVLTSQSDCFIEFHCLLSAQRWGLDDSSVVKIYFGDTNTYCGPMRIIKSYDDYKELRCTIKIPLQKFKEKPGNRRYKYHIVSPNTTKKAIGSFEFISGPKTKSGKIIDRCLKLYINPEKMQCGTTYKYYDGIVWPEILDVKAANESWFSKARDWWSGKSRSAAVMPDESTSSREGDIKGFSHQDHIYFRKHALNLYLNELLNDFATITLRDDPIEIIRTVHAVYASVSSSYLYYDKGEYPWNPSPEEMTEEMYQLLLTATKSLHSSITEDPKQPCLIRVLTLLIMYFKRMLLDKFSADSSNHDFIVTLFRSLTIDHSSYQKACDKILNHYQKPVLQILDIMIGNAITKFEQPIAEWIFAVPLIHFLSNQSEPCGVLHSIPWDFSKLNHVFQWGDIAVLKKIGREPFPASYMEDLQPLFEIDPLLLRFFVYRTPLNNLYSLFGKVPTSIMLMRLAQEFDDFQKYLQIMGILSVLAADFSKVSPDRLPFNESVDVVICSLYVLKMALDKINELDTDNFMLMIRLVLCAVSKTSSNEDSEKISKNVMKHLENYLIQMNGKICRRNIFDVHDNHMLQIQVQYWNKIVKLEKSGCKLWRTVVKSVFITQFPNAHKPSEAIVVLREMDANKGPTVLIEYIFEYVNASFDRYHISEKEVEQLLKGLQKVINSNLSDNVLFLLNKILLKKYKNNYLTMDEVIEWKLWPDVLICCMNSCSLQHPDDLKSASAIGYKALITIIKCCNSIINETITVQELIIYREKIEELKLICSGANSGNMKFCPEFTKINASMDLSFCKYIDVEQYLVKMEVVVEYCRPISNELTQGFSKKSKSALRNTKVCDLISPDNETPPEMLDNFTVFGKDYRTKWFDFQWEKQKAKLSKDGNITYTYIYENVWKPTISSCVSLLNGGFAKSLPLSDIKELYIQNLTTQLERLCSAMHNCYPRRLSFSKPFDWIKGVAKHIEICQKFINNPEHVDAIKFCLKLKESLQLKGDFSDITNVWKCLTTTGEQTTLDDLSAEVMESCTKSTKMYNDSSLQTFFEAYIDNMDLVKWLTEVTSNLQQLKCYIEVCKAIIEKSEFHHLDNLQKVGESLNSLIYCPLDTVGFNEFNKICKSVLNALQRIKNLTSSLNNCAKHIEWYRALKERLGCFDRNKKLPLLYSPPETKSEKYIILDFFCLVSIKQWGLTKSSNVFMRFGAKELGTFSTCHGPMIPTHKRNADSYLELHLAIKIPMCVLHDSKVEVRKYKYHVESSSTENTLEPLEFISGPQTHGGVIDRSLKMYLAYDDIQSGGLYKRFDGIILPEHIKEPPAPGFVTATWNYFTSTNPNTCDGESLDSQKYSTKRLTELNHKELRKSSMYMHLEDVKDALVGNMTINKLMECVDTVFAAYKSLQSYYLCYKYYVYKDHSWNFKEMEKNMAVWLRECLLQDLLNNFINLSKNYIVQNVLCILIIYHKLGFLVDFCNDQRNAYPMKCLLRNMIIDDSLFENGVKPLWSYYPRMLPNSLLTIVKGAIYVPSPLREWIFAIPLLHLLKEECKPFDVLHSIEWEHIGKSSHSYQWGDDMLMPNKELQRLHGEYYQKVVVDQSFMPELQPLFKFDPLLLRVYIKKTAVPYLKSLVGKVPTDILLMRLAEDNLHKIQLPTEASKELRSVIMNELINKSVTSQSEDYTAIVKSSLHLLKSAIGTKKYEDYLYFGIKLVLAALSQIFSSKNELDNIVEDVKYRTTKLLKEIMNEFATKMCKKDAFVVQDKNQRQAEMKYWADAFKIECDDSVKAYWCDICNDVIISRLTVITKPTEIVKIVTELDNDKVHEKVVECVAEHLIESVQQVGQHDMDQTTEFEKLIEQKPDTAKKVLSLFNNFLCNKYPNFTASKKLSIDFMLVGQLWSNVIRLFVKGCDIVKKKDFLKVDDVKETSEIVHAALTELNDLPDNINRGAVTGKEVENFKKQANRLKVLCEAGNVGKSKLVPQFTEIFIALQVCVNKLNAVKEYRAKLIVVKDYCNHISKELTQDICNELDDNSDNKLYDKQVSSVCKDLGNENYECTCFPFSISNVQDEMIQYFIICGKCNDGVNMIFEYYWEQQVNSSNIKMVKDVSFDSIYELVWKETIVQCQQLLSKLNGKTIALKEIESLYQIFIPKDTNAALNENERQCQKDNLSLQLCVLCDAMHHCYPNSRKLFPRPNEWIPQAVDDIVLYNEIIADSRCTKATNVIMKVKKSLKLEKEFKIIEHLQNRANADFKELKLCEVDIHRWNNIRIMYSDAVLHKCLEIFSNNTKLVFWLREATDSVNQLSSFVEVCNSTAGEEEFNTRRLSYLHSVGSDFASLIYELPDDADFDKFDEKCKKVEDLIKSSSKLMDSLEECNKHLDWFVELKETQGSFEVTAMSKVIDIIQFGEYIISSTEGMPLLSIGNAIKLKIHRLNAVKKEYSLDDLRDLESKLVLITGKHTTEKAKTERFLNYLRLVCRIANALVALQNAGHAQYITWSYSFYCDDVYSVLENQAVKMERELERWTDEIAMARNNSHVLNLFTTQQLRVIRQQLGQLNCESISSLPPEVLSMLMSISSKICEKDIKECLQLVKSKSSMKEHHLPEKSENVENSSGYVDHDDNVQMIQFNPEDEVNLKAAVEKLVIRLIDQLSETERNAYEELKEDYSDKVAYLSIKNCNESNLQQENLVEKASVWCLNNEDKYCDKDPQEILNELQALNVQSNVLTENEQNTQCTDDVTSVSSVMQSQNDSVSLMEQTLIDNYIPSGLAREAAELYKYPDEVDEALIYCLNEENKSSDQSDLSLPLAGDRKNPYTERYDKVKVNEYMDLDKLAKILEELVDKYPDRLTAARKFNDSYFTVGEPNLILVSSGRVLKTALSLYCEQDQPFPSMDEVVICTSETTTEDIVLLWRRAVCDPGYKQIFCLLFAEQLSYKICDEALAELDRLSQGKQEFRIVIICSSESEETSHVVSKLLQFKRDYTIFQKDKELSEYLKLRFISDNASSAAAIDPEKLSVRVVSSEKPGMGKSLHVKKLAEKLKETGSYCSVPIHGPVADFNTVMKLLQPFTPSYELPTAQVIHMDIDSEVLSVIDTVLFSLLILKSLKNKNGDVWRLISSQLYMIEVTYCDNDLVNNLRMQQKSTLSLLQLLPSIKCVGPEDSLKPNQGKDVIIDTDEYKNKVFQCVFQYLRRFDARTDLKDFKYEDSSWEGDYSTCVTTIKKHCSIVQPSWAELAQFVRFLNVQLNDCQNSIYCDETLFGEGAEFKKFIVEFMIKMSQDFAMRSLKIAENEENDKEEDGQGNDGKDKDVDGKIDWYQVKKEREWDKSQHPYIFFNQDGMTMTFVGFKVDDTGQCLDVKSNEPIKGCQVPLKVCECLFTQGVNLQKEDCNKWTKKDMIERLWRVFGVDYGEDPDISYVLTSDNFLKMMAIHMRFRCDIPVIIMGETGCGKTRLIRYMCDLQTHDTTINNLVMLKVHGGTTEEDIIEAVVKTEEKAVNNCKINSKLYTILFFDEANTTENLGLIKEIMCDRQLKGRKVNKHVKFIAACNPYRKHTDEMIEKLKTAGLGYYVKDDSTQQKFGNIPLRHLVYRVLDLPLSMRPLLYDFGQVTGNTEDDYIHQIVTNHVHRNKLLSQNPALIENVSRLLLESQSFMRNEKDECSFVSLRDVERAMIVFEWFYENNDFFEELLKKDPGYNKDTNRETRSIILTLAVCYHARIQERENFVQHICPKFKPPISKDEFVEEISFFQTMILSQMDKNIPINIARNAALKENVFMMLVCIELKIPLFVIGKPGSSKSLAKSIIENSMQGQSSNNKLCKKLKQVKLFSYQCSQHSTPSSILEVFTMAKRFQEGKDMKQPALADRKSAKKFVSVVVLDEVGLAEDSPSLPLKALHPLLEDGTSGADAKIIAREDRVAFVGISNWALDPAKMNRGVMITRGSPDEKELEQSARGICSNNEDDPVRDKLDVYLNPLSKAYKEICNLQTREFFGLRDFYSLIKMLYWMVSKTASPLTMNQLIHAIQRNFDGLDEFNATKIFLTHIKPDKQAATSDIKQIATSADNNEVTTSSENDQVSSSTENIQTALSVENSQTANSAEDIKGTVSMESDQTGTSSEEKQTEDIHNATSTENIHAATLEPSKQDQALYTDCEPLELIKASLDTKDISWHGESRYLLFMTENFAALRVLQQHLLRNEDKLPFVLFGSSFPKDMEYTQVCRNINQIKICMETGRTVILLNLENLYESLYDVLNQYYTKLRENRYVDLGLQSHRIKCRVDDNFKMILIAEKETVYKDFPTPLINRLEKHFVVTSTILTKSQKEIMSRLINWAKDFTLITKLKDVSRLKLGDAFVGYQEDTPAAVVFQAYHHFKAINPLEKDDEIEMSEEQKDQIFEKGKSLLLDIASPDAIVRLKYSILADEFDTVYHTYFIEQSHSSLSELLSSKLSMSLHEHNKENNDESVGLTVPGQKEMLLLQVTTHSHLLSEPDVTQLCKALKITRRNITCCLLQEFDTEMDFCNRLKLVMEENVVGHKILIIQCDCGHLHSNLIACARHKVIDEIIVPQSSKNKETTEDIQSSTKETEPENIPAPNEVKTRKEAQSSNEKSVVEETQSFSNNETSEDASSSNKETKSVDGVEVKSKMNSNMSSEVQKKCTVHVVFIVQLPRKAGGTNFVGFQGGNWLSVHLDDLRSLKENELSFQSAIQCSISEIFNSMYQCVTSATSEKEPELVPLDQKLESSSAEEEPESPGNSQCQSLSLSIPRPSSVTTNKFQSVYFNANRRLRDLIQMACSWLYDTEQNRERTTWLYDTDQNRERTTKRISILTDLIPTESTREMSSFDCRLVQFVTAVLKEMDSINPEAKDWAFDEALKHSQISGTFRNALSRRLDKILLPILAKIIALIDKNFNLTIIHENRDSKKISSPIAKLWLEIFSERSLCRISYEDIFSTNNVSKTKKWVPGIGATLSDQFYKCTFPFSWICREVINAQKRDAAVLAERYNVNSFKKMTELVASSPLGTIFNICVPNDDKDAHTMLCCSYLNDYIFSAYRPSMVDEKELIYEAVNSRFNQLFKQFCGDSSTFLEKIVVLHLAYAVLEPQLQQFQQLVSLSPKIVSSVYKKLKEDKDSDFKNEISDIAFSAVKVLLIELTHDKNWDKDKTKRWIQDVSYYQNSINSILNLKTVYDSTNARKDWIRILVLKTFAVTIGLHYNNDHTLAALQRLTTFLKKPDFKKVEILIQIAAVLHNLQSKMKASWELKEEADFKDKAKENVVKQYSEFISCCEKYFIEIITNFCFEQTYDANNPEPAMIDYLTECIFVKNESTKSITPFVEREGDKVPVVRSYLLQLLIDLQADYTWEKVESYFTRSRSLAEENDTGLYVLCVQCFEDKHYKDLDRTKEMAENCLNLLETNMNEYVHTMELFTIKYFNVIAAIRFCLSQFSGILYEWCGNEENQTEFPKEWLETLQTVKRHFSSHKSKYPAEYFIKHIIRQHGIKLFNQLRMCEEPSFQWIIPEHLKNKEESDHCITNPAVVYCGGSHPSFFDELSESLTQAISSEDTTELDKVLKDMSNPNCCVMVMMAIYANVALKESPPSHPDQDVKNSKGSIMTVAHHGNFSFYPSPLPLVVANYLTKFIADSPSFNNALKGIANDLLCGIHHFKLDVKLQALQPKQIFGIIIHCVTVFHQREDVEFLKPCVELLKRLSSMKAMYLPTMPEVCEFKSDLQLMGTYYICDGKKVDTVLKRHRFLLVAEDCEKLDQNEMKCLFCQMSARKDDSVKPKDEKATGHILGSAGSRSKDQVQERSLSPTNCSILRVFLHAILTWSTSFIDKGSPPNLDGCISPPIPTENLEHFFLRNLEQDLITLSSSLGRSIDDAVLIIHLILKQLSQLPDIDFPGYIGKWSNCEERQKWENDFSETVVDDVIINIEDKLRDTYTSAMKDPDTLYSRIYESKEENDPHFALWRYRTRLSLEHLSCSIQSKKHKILSMFLQQEPTLRAMQYLPGILKLQRFLFDSFHQQIGQEKALCETIGEYKKRLQKDKKVEMFTELVQLFNKAWLLLKNQLINYGRLRVPIEYTIDTPEITDDTKLAYLMPTSTGDSEGICSSSMVDFLVYQHNEFIQFCYKNMPETYYDPNICKKFLENTIPLSQLQACHVLNYEHKLIPVILTHCQYSLRYGEGTKVDYDFEAIEKDLFDKFMFGKPLIFIDEMPKVVFRKDAHDASFYESIMASVPQNNLQPEKKKTLTDEIIKLSMHRDPHKLSELLDVVEIVLGFLASAGGKPDQNFHSYVTKTLTMQRAHIPKGVKECTLSTTVSLWRIVSVVQSCKLTTLDKEPFDRLDNAYCVSLEEAQLLELQKTLKKIESPIDFLIALHNFIAVFVSHRSPTEDCNPEWRITEVWKEAMESSDFYHKVDLKSVIISDDIKMSHTAAVWKQAVGLLWPKENQQ